MTDLVPGDAGILVEPGDIPALRAALATVLTDVDRADRMAAASIRAGEHLPRWQDTVRIVKTVLDRKHTVQFSADWLSLREPADLRARNPGIAHKVRDLYAGRDRINICDLGAGTGSSIRALAGLLPASQDWTLIDHDPALLDAARMRLRQWADDASGDEAGSDLRLTLGASRINVSMRVADLRRDLDAVVPRVVDLINGSALIDLVSEQWLDHLVAVTANRGAALLMTLSYDGEERWSPPHPADARVLERFVAHQQGVKEFGPALGPRAADALAVRLKRIGYDVVTAPSPWTLDGARDGALIAALAEGVAAAASASGDIPQPIVSNWLDAHRMATAVEVGHVDLFAYRS